MNMRNDEPISFKLRFQILKRDNFTCQYCGRKAPDTVLHVDHIVPRELGGKNDPENLVTCCIVCNLGKGDEPLEGSSSVKKRSSQREATAEIVAVVALLSNNGREPVNLTSIANHLNINKSSVSRRMKRCLELGEVCLVRPYMKGRSSMYMPSANYRLSQEAS